jgi:hypothetical protein
MSTPSKAEFQKGIQAFQEREKRDAMYKVATFLIDHFWGNPHEMADSLGVLLLTWNQALYRYGSFDYDKLEQCISQNMDFLIAYRHRNILSFSDEDNQPIRNIFKQFLAALRICEGKKKGKKKSCRNSKSFASTCS